MTFLLAVDTESGLRFWLCCCLQVNQEVAGESMVAGPDGNITVLSVELPVNATIKYVKAVVVCVFTAFHLLQCLL